MGDVCRVRGSRWDKKSVLPAVGEVGITVPGCRAIFPDAVRTSGGEMWPGFCDDCPRSTEPHQRRAVRRRIDDARRGTGLTVYYSGFAGRDDGAIGVNPAITRCDLDFRVNGSQRPPTIAARQSAWRSGRTLRMRRRTRRVRRHRPSASTNAPRKARPPSSLGHTWRRCRHEPLEMLSDSRPLRFRWRMAPRVHGDPHCPVSSRPPRWNEPAIPRWARPRSATLVCRRKFPSAS
jgi:hypothetical protein